MIAKAFGIIAISVAPILLGVGSPVAHADPGKTPPATTGAATIGAGDSALVAVLPQLTEFASSTITGLIADPSGIYPEPVLKAIALTIVPLDQFGSFDQIITHESSWRTFAINPSSGAYGLAQALPAHKMSETGFDWPINPVTQLRWAYRYMCERYGSPNAAWAFWQANHWY